MLSNSEVSRSDSCIDSLFCVGGESGEESFLEKNGRLFSARNGQSVCKKKVENAFVSCLCSEEVPRFLCECKYIQLQFDSISDITIG